MEKAKQDTYTCLHLVSEIGRVGCGGGGEGVRMVQDNRGREV